MQIHTIYLAPQWQLALRADLPFLAKDPINSGNPNGDYLYGVGDADIQAALIHEFDARLTAGFGARLIAPTGGDGLGSGKWQIMPGAAVKYTLPEISSGSHIEPLVRYVVSFAGDPSTRNISSLEFAPTVNLGLPDRWFLTLYPSPDIRINYGDPVTGQTGAVELSVQRKDRTQDHRQSRAFARGWRAHNQRLSGLRLQDRGQARSEVLRFVGVLTRFPLGRCRSLSPRSGRRERHIPVHPTGDAVSGSFFRSRQPPDELHGRISILNIPRVKELKMGLTILFWRAPDDV